MKIVNFILFQIAWFITILSAAYGKPIIGVLFTLLWVISHFFIINSDKRSELILLVSAAALAYLFESSLVITGYINYPEQALLGMPPPVWMITLWINLALTINYSLSWLKRRYVLAALLASIAGPLAYAAGERLGAIILHGMPSLIAIALMWCIAMPILFWFSHVLVDLRIFNSRLISDGMD